MIHIQLSLNRINHPNRQCNCKPNHHTNPPQKFPSLALKLATTFHPPAMLISPQFHGCPPSCCDISTTLDIIFRLRMHQCMSFDDRMSIFSFGNVPQNWTYQTSYPYSVPQIKEFWSRVKLWYDLNIEAMVENILFYNLVYKEI